MLEFRQISESSIKVFKENSPEEKIGSITDQCCYTLFYLNKIQYPIKIKYEVGKGGFLSKKKDGLYVYRDKMIEIFTYLQNSESLKILLKKKTIDLSRSHIEEGRYLSILQVFEKEIKL